MNKKVLGILSGLLIFLVGAAFLLVGWSYSSHQQLLSKADALRAERNFAEALNAYRQAEAHYTKTFWGIPQGPIFDSLDAFEFKTRSYIKLRLAEMAFREGERLLALYGRVHPADTAAANHPRDEDVTAKPSLEEVMKHFNAAGAQYKQAQQQTQDQYWQFIANANRARAMVQTFLIEAFLEEQPQDPIALKQSLVRAIKSLQSALNTLYTDQVRVSLAEERSLLLLLEALTRFQRAPEVEAEERQRLERFFKETLTNPDIAPLGEILRSSDLKSFSPEEGDTMREFLLNEAPSSVFREQIDRPRPGSRTGLGSADPGSEKKMH